MGSSPTHNYKLTSLTKQFGGCGGNLAYNLSALDADVNLISWLGGADGDDYVRHLSGQCVDTQSILILPECLSSHAYIVTDPNLEQLTAFFDAQAPTAQVWTRHVEQRLRATATDLLQAPLPPWQTLAALAVAGPHRFNTWVPGQYAERFDREALERCLEAVDCVVGNLREIAQLRACHQDALAAVTVVETRGAHDVIVQAPDTPILRIPVPRVTSPVDPTGCGDAFAAGFALERAKGHANLEQCAMAGIRQAQRCLVHQGAQNH